MTSLSLKELTQFMAMVADENMLSSEQSQWIYHKLNIVGYIMKRDKKESLNQEEFRNIITSKNNFELIKDCPIKFVQTSAKELNEALLSIDAIQMQMENILLGEWNQYSTWNQLLNIKKERESFSWEHIKAVIKYTYWVAFVGTVGMMIHEEASTVQLIQAMVGFVAVWAMKNAFFGWKDKFQEKKIEKALSMEMSDSQKAQSTRYNKLMDIAKNEFNPVNWTMNSEINEDLALLKNQSIRLAVLMDKKKRSDSDYAEEWYSLQSMWEKHIPRLIDITGEDANHVKIVKLTIVSMQKVLQGYIDSILEEDMQELTIKQKFWATKASVMP